MDIKTFTCSTSQELKHRFVHLTVRLYFISVSLQKYYLRYLVVLSSVLCLLELGHRASAGTGEHRSVCSCAAGGGGEERGRTVSHQLHGSFAHSCECCPSVCPSLRVCYSVTQVSPAVCLQGVVEFSLCLLFAKLVSYTFLFWLPLYITKAGNLHYLI